MSEKTPFWKVKKLEEFTISEWESLCDGCGRCCLHKVEDEDTGDIYTTSVACRLLDGETCRCRNYVHRKSIVSNCISLDVATVKTARWLPENCAYRLINEGKDLQWWHPLVSGNRQTVHQTAFSARERIEIHEDELSSEEDYLYHITGLLCEG
ncbi:YcgN family cysteine cluster protein [Bartonella machadoae]|uniref:YcgN family cysteine cluster protein n=1 Tax=Bartonella machadoae TaxID=2893471 RepID=UPI001F4C626C|nr:YcgN family cysteine cluster protein [Bartonella machadoae]UNE53700.1 YcgN family cysteine cluster protein [Bartonella machadoae]